MIAQPAAGGEHFTAAVGSRLDGSPLAVMLDIDGTLAPIAPRPDDADVPEGMRAVLRRLVALPTVSVALVTGRSVEDAQRMAVEGVWIIGNHGLELRTPDGELSASKEAATYHSAIQSAARDLAPLERQTPGAILENKRWGLSLHYRLVTPNAVPALIDRAREVANALGLRVFEGKKLVELRPPVRIDKGTAALAFAERVGALRKGASVFYAGDDQTDEDAFRALRAGARDPRAVTARVRDDEEDGATEAEFVLASPDELQRALHWLVARRGRRG